MVHDEVIRVDITVQPVSLQGTEAGLVGNPTVLQQPLTCLFCSQKCPGELILKAYDAAKQLRERGWVVISGFHSPIEKDMLPILLRGRQPVVICLARSLEGMRLPAEYREPIEDGRLALLSLITGKENNRIIQKNVDLRNQWVVDLSSKVLIIYADPGGKIDHLCTKILLSGKDVFAIKSLFNQHLFEAGAKAWE